VILMTGAPTMETAVAAVEHGAFRYLVKPVDLKVLREAVLRATRFRALALLKRQALEIVAAEGMQLGDRASLEARFANAIETLWMAYQPIISWHDRRVFGYEALVRNQEPLLMRPDSLIAAAERLGRIRDLGRIIRGHVAAAAIDAPAGITIFTNLHARDLEDDALSDPASPLSSVADRVVLEITERASLADVKNVAARVTALRKAGFRIAIDDLGAGYAGLTSFAILEPEVVKLDLSLVRDVNSQATKQSVIRSMVSLCRDLGMSVVCEGVETAAELSTLTAIGCDLHQGFLFAKPGRGFPDAHF
jgi:EAL domain-containing protein (putative c-di-GMP-specific phosphodiesterase class I)